MQRVNEFWEWIPTAKWGELIATMPWWGWLSLVVFFTIGVVILADKDLGRGLGTIGFLLTLAVVGVVVTILAGLSFSLLTWIFFPPMIGLAVGGGIGVIFAEKGKAQRCSDCGGRIVQERYVDKKTNRKGTRTICKSCKKTWLDSLD